MTAQPGGYDDRYSRVDALFGTEPEAVLGQFLSRLTEGAAILDVGAGQGRNALYLARQGFVVDALEPSVVAGSTLQRLADQERLALNVFAGGFESFDPPVSAYAGIGVFGLFPDLDPATIRGLVSRIADWGANGTLVWVTGFTTEDPAFETSQTQWESCGTNSFVSPEGTVRTYLEPGEILELFARYTVLRHWEGLGPEHRHGNGPAERHGKFEAVLLREFG